MGLSVTVKKFGTAVGVVMSLKHYVNIVCVKDWSELCTKDHSVCIRVVKTGTVNILMDGNHTPGCIRVSFYCFLDGILMLCYVVVVGVQNNEKSVAIAVVIVTASCCFSIFCVVRVVEMVCIVRIQGIVVSDGSCYRKTCRASALK